MRPLLIELEDFGSFAGSHGLDLSGVSRAAVVGENGAGKSTLVYDALGFALAGVTRAGDTDSVVRTGAEQGRVAVTFEVDGTSYRVTRVRQRAKKTSAWVEKADPGSATGWETVTESKGVRETDECVAGLLGASWDALAATVFAGQGDADRFTGQYGAARRKELLGEIVGLGQYTRLADLARQTSVSARSDADRERARLDEIDTMLASADEDRSRLADATAAETAAVAAAEKAAEAADRAVAAKDAAVSALVEARTSAAAADRDRDRLADAAKAARRAADAAAGRSAEARRAAVRAAEAVAAVVGLEADLAARAAERDSLESRLGDLRAAGEAAAERKATAEAMTVSAEETVERAQARVAALAGGDDACPTCGQDLTDQHLSVVAADAETELAAALATVKTRRDEATAAGEDREQLLGEWKAAKTEADRLAAAHSEIAARLERARAAAENADGAADAAEVADAEAAEAAAEAEVAETAAASAAVEAGPDVAALDAAAVAASGDAAAAVVAAEDARRRSFEAHAHAAALTERVAAHDTAEARRVEVTAAWGQADRSAGLHQTLARAFGRDGIPALIFDGVVAELGDAVNEILARLANGRLAVTISTVKETKSGSSADTLEVTVHGPDGPRPYESFSGGERFRVDLALRVGLSRLLARRTGTQIRTLVLDEGWGALDDEGVAAMVECLRVLGDEFDLVLTVTHIENVADAFPVKIRVNRTGVGSSVDVTAD